MQTAKDDVYLGDNIPGLALKRRGKVRDLYELPEGLLLVTTDRVSAFDVIFHEGIPGKGRALTAISAFWFHKTRGLFPNHLISTDVQEIPSLPKSQHNALRNRIMLCQHAEVIPFEFVVRGYLSGSGFESYKKDGAICGIKLPPGLKNSSKLPEPILTPTTKAEQGHDEAVSYAEVAEQIGSDLAVKVRDAALKLYHFATKHAEKQGIIIADTKFEFGLLEGKPLVIDEMLTPDSSRFWSMQDYQPGKSQPSYDKQIIRDYLLSTTWPKTPPPPPLPAEIINRAALRYKEIEKMLTGKVNS